MMNFTSEEARILLRNKFVVVLGDSIQRTVYKDLVLFLQKSNHLTDEQLRTKCEQSFEGDCQLEASKPTNSTEFRETRQFCDPFHLLRFHFLTCVYSPYVEEILERFQAEALPDILIINSCVWDISRYGKDSKTEYWKNLEHLFIRLREVLPADCLVIWSLAMPLGSRLKGGFLPSEQEELYRNLRKDVMEANFYAAKLAAAYEFDVLDLHFRFRQRLEQRAADGIHWDEHAHRTITQLLLHHIAEAWGICLPQHRAPVPTSRGVGPRQSGPLRWNGAVENHFTSDLPESSLRYMSFRDAPGPEVQVPWEVGAQGSASRNWNYFRSDLPEPCPPSVRFRNASGPDGPPTARAFAPLSQAMDDPQFWNYSWRLVCNRRVMRRRVNRGRAQEPYSHSSAHQGRCRPAYSVCRGFSH